MPELPDVVCYVRCLERRLVGRASRGVLVRSPFVLRTFDLQPDAVVGRRVETVGRIGKRVLIGYEGALFHVIHPMIAGRFRWSDKPDAKPPAKGGLVAWRFEHGSLVLVEHSTKKRAALHVVEGEAGLRQFDRGGLNVFTCSAAQFGERLRSENHTLKRSLTDPRLFDGIGNAFSDEVLHAAGLSPLKWSTRLTDGETARLHAAAVEVLTRWTDTLCERFAERFPGPGDITAFRPEFAAHGKFGEPCPVCDTKIQRIVYADRETNYCPRCQTDGKLLADRSLSRLLHDDWPKTIEELEEG